MKVPFSKISCNGNELKYVTEVLDSGWLTTAGKTLEFEKQMAEYVGAKYTCAVNSCTAALHLGLEALGVKRGDKVFVPDMTFTASAEVVRYMGADPIFLDVEFGTSLITPEILKKAIVQYPEIKVLILVHFGGHPAEMTNEQGDGIWQLCQKHGIKLLEDAAHAFPTKFDNKYIGSWGDITCFSFYANKTITTGEGGMLLTNDISIYERVKTMRLHGINRDVWNRFTSNKPSWEYDVVAAGFKYNMPDLNAAIGLAQLEKAEEFRQKRQNIVEKYYKNLSSNPKISLPQCKVNPKDHAWHLFPIVLNDSNAIKRNELIEYLAKEGIGTSVHYKPLHRMTYYKNEYDLAPHQFPVAEKIWQGTITLPLFPDMTLKDCNYVCEKINELL